MIDENSDNPNLWHFSEKIHLKNYKPSTLPHQQEFILSEFTTTFLPAATKLMGYCSVRVHVSNSHN